MNRLRIVIKFICHFLTAKNTKGFGVHSPYLFHFTKIVIYNKSSYYIFSSIEEIRRKLKKDNRILNVEDFGTGTGKNKSIAEITSKSIKEAKYGQLLYRVTDYIKARNILEFGTSLGLTTLYLASSSTSIRVISLEGSTEIANIAIENFRSLNIKNIQIVTGNIDLTLSEVLKGYNQLDLVFMDANHKSTAVLSYFDECLKKIHKDSMIVVDDIYWSPDMEIAWKKIKDNPKVTATIDLFQMGIVFFNPDLHKMHYKMRY